MKKQIGILDLGGISNVFNVNHALNYFGYDGVIIKNPKQMDELSKIIIPGVGSFPSAMKEVKKVKKDILKKLKNKTVLGICLGMQIMGSMGFEFKKIKGLNLIKGNIKKIKNLEELPHVGFKRIDIKKKSGLFKNIPNKSEFYFTHSFEFTEIEKKYISAVVSYKNKIIIAAIKKDNFYGTQFHPEKSSKIGLKLFKNFLDLKIKI